MRLFHTSCQRQDWIEISMKIIAGVPQVTDPANPFARACKRYNRSKPHFADSRRTSQLSTE